MGHYKSNLRDLEFNLFEVFDRHEILGTGPFADLDRDVVRTLLDEVNRLAEGVLADSFAEGDRTPPVFDPATGAVTLPEGFKKSFAAWQEDDDLGVADAGARRPRPETGALPS